MSDKILIHTIGDSHCWHAWLKIPFVQTHTAGPMLMHTFGQAKSVIVSELPKDAIICFCWGEIDCRCHVHKYPPYEKTIDELVENYLAAIAENAKTHKNIWVFNVVPPPRRDGAQENPSFPFLGTDEERLKYVRYMNQCLRIGCQEKGYLFVDIYNQYADKDGFLRPEMSDGHVHIAEPAPLRDWVLHQLKDPLEIQGEA